MRVNGENKSVNCEVIGPNISWVGTRSGRELYDDWVSDWVSMDCDLEGDCGDVGTWIFLYHICEWISIILSLGIFLFG